MRNILIILLFISGLVIPSFAAQDISPEAPVISITDSVLCQDQETSTLTVTNPDSIDILQQTVGAPDLSIGPYASFTAVVQYMNFSVQSSSVKIVSLDMFFGSPAGAGFTIIIRRASDQQTVFTKSGTVSISSPATPQVVTLNSELPLGNYQIGLSVNPGVYRNSSGTAYPYNTPSPGISITGNTFGAAFYYYFYNWQVEVPVLSYATYNWMPGNFTGNSITISPNATTTYTVTATKPSGHTSSSAKTVYYNNVITPFITPGGPTTFCKGGSISLEARQGYAAYSWHDGNVVVGTTRIITETPNQTKTYTVTVNNGNECTASASQIIDVTVLPPPNISPGDTSFCAGGSVVLDAGSGFSSYSWSKGGGVLGTSQTLHVNTSGNYTVTVTSGCTTSSVAVVQVNPIPPPVVVTPNIFPTLCANGADPYVILFADTTGSGENGTIVWNDIFGGVGNKYYVHKDDINLQFGGNTYNFQAQIVTEYGCTNFSNFTTVNIIHCPTTINLKVFLQGFYIGNQNMLPVLSTQYVNNATGNEADTIQVELRDVSNPSVVVAKSVALLMTDGTGYSAFPVSAGTYWLVIKHRNSIETWSAAPVTLPNTMYDFSTAAGKAYADNMIDVYNEGIWSLFAADINQDDFIDIFDFAEYESDNSAFVNSSYVSTDINGDGYVDIFDFQVFDLNNYSFVFSIQP